MKKGSPKLQRAHYRSKRSTQQQEQLSTYNLTTPFISFGPRSTILLLLFFIIYAVSMISLIPMIRNPSTNSIDVATNNNNNNTQTNIHSKIQNEEESSGNAQHKSRWRLRRESKATMKIKKTLLDSAMLEFQQQQQKKKEKHPQPIDKPAIITTDTLKVKKSKQEDPKPISKEIINQHIRENKEQNEKVGGFVVLGMHRSGTSMLSGLLAKGFGYQVGEPVVKTNFDNEKGFFEFLPVVLQNDEFMYDQDVWWAANVGQYKSDVALKKHRQGKFKFKEGKKALEFLNDERNHPFMQKDPRMCITLPTWLPLLHTKPAVVFTYRHPLEVAMSLKKREQDFTLERGFRLWIWYNRRAVENSMDLCRVYSSNVQLLANPQKETERIVEELTTKCHVLTPPQKITKETVEKFVDPSLQHNKKQRESKDAEMKVLKTYGTDCQVKEYESDVDWDSEDGKREKELYFMAMKIYCDFESGAPYLESYNWPSKYLE